MAKSEEERRAERKAKLKKYTRDGCKVASCTMAGFKIGALVSDPVICPLVGFSYGVYSVLKVKDDIAGDVGPTVLDVVLEEDK